MAMIVSLLLLALLCTGAVIVALEVRRRMRQTRSQERDRREVIERAVEAVAQEQVVPRIIQRVPVVTPRAPAPPPVEQKREREIVADKTGADIYVDWCVNRLGEVVQDHGQERERLVRCSTDTAKQLRELASKQRDLEVVQGVFDKLRQDRVGALEGVFNTLTARETVARIEVTDSGWLIVTTPLTMEQGKDTYELGKMAVHLDQSGRARLFNQTNRPVVRGSIYDHPLVRDGEPLLPATVRCQLALSVGRKQINEAFNVLLVFLTKIPEITFIPANVWQKEIRHEKKLALRF